MFRQSYIFKGAVALGLSTALLTGSARAQRGAAPAGGSSVGGVPKPQSSGPQGPLALPGQPYTSPTGQSSALAPLDQQSQTGTFIPAQGFPSTSPSPFPNGTGGFPTTSSTGFQNNGLTSFQSNPSSITNGLGSFGFGFNNLPTTLGGGFGQISNPGLASTPVPGSSNNPNALTLPNGTNLGNLNGLTLPNGMNLNSYANQNLSNNNTNLGQTGGASVPVPGSSTSLNGLNGLTLPNGNNLNSLNSLSRQNGNSPNGLTGIANQNRINPLNTNQNTLTNGTGQTNHNGLTQSNEINQNGLNGLPNQNGFNQNGLNGLANQNGLNNGLGGSQTNPGYATVPVPGSNTNNNAFTLPNGMNLNNMSGLNGGTTNLNNLTSNSLNSFVQPFQNQFPANTLLGGLNGLSLNTNESNGTGLGSGTIPSALNGMTTGAGLAGSNLNNPLIGTTSGLNFPFGGGGVAVVGSGMGNSSRSNDTPQQLTLNLQGGGTAVPQRLPALVDINVPANATVYIQGRRLDQTGLTRHYLTSALRLGEREALDVRAVWNEDGHEMTAIQPVTVFGGDHKSISIISGTAISIQGKSR